MYRDPDRGCCRAVCKAIRIEIVRIVAPKLLIYFIMVCVSGDRGFICLVRYYPYTIDEDVSPSASRSIPKLTSKCYSLAIQVKSKYF